MDEESRDVFRTWLLEKGRRLLDQTNLSSTFERDKDANSYMEMLLAQCKLVARLITFRRNCCCTAIELIKWCAIVQDIESSKEIDEINRV